MSKLTSTAQTPPDTQAMSGEMIRAAALRDPGAQPLTDDEMTRMPRIPRTKTIRPALRFTQEEFAARYQIPIGTLRDWEQGPAEPDQPARAYLRVIADEPEAIQRALTEAPIPAT